MNGNDALVGLNGHGSRTIQNDLRFNGGVVGVQLSGQQWMFKNFTLSGSTTSVVAGGTNIVVLVYRSEYGAMGIDASGTSSSLTVMDSAKSNLGTLMQAIRSLENVQNRSPTVSFNGNTILSGSVLDTWVHGNLVSCGSNRLR